MTWTVAAPVKSVFFATGSNVTFDSAVTSSYDVIESRDPKEEERRKDGAVEQLIFLAGVRSVVACVAVGGYPPPQVRVHLGQASEWIFQPSPPPRRSCFHRC